jgi:hypothetical protein
LKKGKHHRIPERPADLKVLWEEGRVLDARNLPSWLSPEESAAYRLLGTSSLADVPAEERASYCAELEELEAGRIILDPDPYDARVHHLFLAAPANEAVWSIGLFRGPSPLELGEPAEIRNPVLTAEDVTDVTAAFVADPFMLRAAGGWHMFFEVMNWRANKGEIGWAASDDGLSWKYRQIVLREPFHLSYPYVFEWAGEFYMVPESYQANAIRLYKAVHFPTHWTFVKSLIEGPYLVDATLFFHREKWWLFTDASEEMKNDTLRLFFADDLMGQWQEHPRSPLRRGDSLNARPAGRVTTVDGRLFRFAQRCKPFYGTDVRAFEITELSPTSYGEKAWPANPVLRPGGTGWNACGMHHIDVHLLDDATWLASVDGWCWG